MQQPFLYKQYVICRAVSPAEYDVHNAWERMKRLYAKKTAAEKSAAGLGYLLFRLRLRLTGEQQWQTI